MKAPNEKKVAKRQNDFPRQKFLFAGNILLSRGREKKLEKLMWDFFAVDDSKVRRKCGRVEDGLWACHRLVRGRAEDGRKACLRRVLNP